LGDLLRHPVRKLKGQSFRQDITGMQSLVVIDIGFAERYPVSLNTNQMAKIFEVQPK